MPKNALAMPPRSTPLRPRRKALLIGASSGIGAALARRLAQEGYDLALLARRKDLLQRLCEEINTACGEVRAVYYVHDVRDRAAVPALLQRILADLGSLDLVIYNAGVNLPAGPEAYDFEKDLLMTEINYVGALAWLDHAAAIFQQLKSGQIVGISSVAGDRGRAGNPAYTASKAALTCYLEALRNRLSRYGVHVLTVRPGFVATDMLKQAQRPFMVISPEQAAADICKAIRRRRQSIYTPARWGWIMLVIRLIPSFIFRRLRFLA
ncbi:MAG: SDR family NAD(P)-dependent oxidoreductase [Anaerolineales bacterium]